MKREKHKQNAIIICVNFVQFESVSEMISANRFYSRIQLVEKS